MDATLISSATRPRKTYKSLEKDGEIHVQDNPQLSADPDVKWIKKGKTCTFGYKGYASQANRDTLKELGIKDWLMRKAKRGRPLTSGQRLFNKVVSKTRFRVKQCFVTLKRKFYFSRSSYMGLDKNWGQFIEKVVL